MLNLNYTITITLGVLIAFLIGKLRGYKIEKEDVLLSVGLILLGLQIDRKGFDWAINNFISLFIAISLFDFIRTKVKKWGEG